MESKNRAVFFDRDGTLNVDVHYLYRAEDFVWTPDAMAAIQYCNAQGYLVIVVTNQSGVARGFYTEADVHRLHAWMNEELAGIGAHIDAFYYCPHHVEGRVPVYTKQCDCRKPSPKMVQTACREHQIDPEKSFFVGDQELDMECAARAGVCGVQYRGGSLLACVQNAVRKGAGDENEV